MPRKKPETAIAPAVIESRIHIIRGQRVMLDSDLAALYGVTTFALNQAVKRNASRFPEDFAFVLTPHELTDLISQNVISSSGHGGRRKPPRAFTEHGVAMLSGVLHSKIAVRVNIEIIRTFIRMRRLLATPGELVALIQKLSETVQLHDTQIKAIAEVLRQMTESPPEATPKGRFGFHPPEPSSDSKVKI